ncbi:MAG: hypothetical protein ACI9E1_001476 [Cryomorphaceae bacterium]|jgi:hypothetical protein
MPQPVTLTSQWISQWPVDGTALDLPQALGEAQRGEISADISAIKRSLETAEKLSQHPILAVTGQLNSGKSSVVASFLSPSGKARVPRGSSSSTGTHRFVYWVPQSWLDDIAFRELLLDLIATAHPNGLEFLDDDPERAAEQYRSGRDHLETLSIPLIAGDPLLDELGTGLLDCPDIQTHDHDIDQPSLLPSENPRLDFLSAAARVCSAFLVVWNRAAIRDRLIETMLSALRQRMASAPLYLLINMIRPEEGQPQRTMTDSDVTRLLEQFSIAPDHVYGAFDFAIEDRAERAGWRSYTPARLVEKFDKAEAPQFYPLADGVQSRDDLQTLSENLDIAEIQRIKITDHQTELSNLLEQANTSISQWVNNSEKEISQIHEGLLTTCHRMMSDETTGEPLQIMSPQFASALHASLVRTAPFALKLPLKLANPFDKAYDSTKKFIRTLNLKTLASDKIKDLEGELKQHLKLGSIKIASSDALARRMQSQRWCPASVQIPELETAWNGVFDTFQKHPIESFDTELLDLSSKDRWDGFSMMQKFTIGGKALLGTIGGLAAVCGIATLAVDGGATFFAATSVSHAINGSIAAVIAAGGGAVAMAGFQESLLKDNTLPYLSRLFSITCDCFHIPRAIRDEPTEVNFQIGDNTKANYKLAASPELPIFPAITPLTDKRIWDKEDT